MALNYFVIIGIFSIVSRGGESADFNGVLGEFECGEALARRANGQTSTVTSTLGSTPWHVAIYDVPSNPSSKWTLLCGGSIVSPNLVITAASCVFNDRIRVLMNTTSIRIVAGKIHINLNVDPENAQVREVLSITAPDSFLGEITGYGENIAVLYTEPPFFQSDYITPVCIDWNGTTARNEPQLRQLTRNVEVTSWGFGGRNPSGILQEGTFPTEDNKACRATHRREQIVRYISYDKFCILTPRGRIKEDAGSGVVIKVNGKYYLTGIVSSLLDQKFSVATNVSKHGPWLMKAVDKINDKIKCKDGFACGNHVCIPISKKCNGQIDCTDSSDEDEELCADARASAGPGRRTGCELPLQLSGVSYRIENCEGNTPCVKLAGTTVENGQTVHMSCGRGTIHSSKGPRYACLGGQWFQERPICMKMCLPRRKLGVSVICEFNGAPMNCNDYMKPGTSAIAKCKRLHRGKDTVVVPERSTCHEDGEWSSELPTCIPECGKPNHINDGALTISHGHNATYGKYPWHVALYIKNATTNAWDQSCGGTIISVNMVMTAAHCVHNVVTDKVISADSVLVAGGKVKRDLTAIELHQQSARVKELLVPKGYQGFATQYEYDITLLYMATPFNVTDFVLPCCIDLSSSIPPLPKINAIVVGWGYTEKNLQPGIRGTPSPHLLETTLPIINNIDCRALDADFIPYLTFDKICGVYKGDSGPQKGDSGGGLVVKQGDLHFIIGVISIKPTYSNRFGAFTNIALHRNWISKTMQSYQ